MPACLSNIRYGGNIALPRQGYGAVDAFRRSELLDLLCQLVIYRAAGTDKPVFPVQKQDRLSIAEVIEVCQPVGKSRGFQEQAQNARLLLSGFVIDDAGTSDEVPVPS